MNLKKFKKLSGDASFRQFYRTNNSVLVYSKIQKRSNLLNYDAVNKILIKNKILAPGLIGQNFAVLFGRAGYNVCMYDIKKDIFIKLLVLT